MSAVREDISDLPQEEQDIIREEFKKCWEEMDEDRCKTERGRSIVKSERSRKYHYDEYRAGML